MGTKCARAQEALLILQWEGKAELWDTGLCSLLLGRTLGNQCPHWEPVSPWGRHLQGAAR